MENINDFYDEIVRLLRELQRQYGIANVNYTAYALERLENCIITCSHCGKLTPKGFIWRTGRLLCFVQQSYRVLATGIPYLGRI